MLLSLTVLLSFQLLGEVIVRLSGVPLPGPVVGMLLLFVALLVRGGIPSELRQTSATLLSHLSLLFVPAGTGVMLHVARVRDEWLPIAASLLLSTVLTMAVTAVVLRLLARRAAPAAGSAP